MRLRAGHELHDGRGDVMPARIGLDGSALVRHPLLQNAETHIDPPWSWVVGSPEELHREDPALRSVCLLRCDLRTVQLQRSEEHTSELQSLMRISYAVFCLKKKN